MNSSTARSDAQERKGMQSDFSLATDEKEERKRQRAERIEKRFAKEAKDMMGRAKVGWPISLTIDIALLCPVRLSHWLLFTMQGGVGGGDNHSRSRSQQQVSLTE